MTPSLRAMADEYQHILQIKLAEEGGLTESTLRAVDTVRPYAYRAAMGALPGAMLGNTFYGKKGGMIGAGVGAGIGVADKYMETVSEKNKKMRALLSSYQQKL